METRDSFSHTNASVHMYSAAKTADDHATANSGTARNLRYPLIALALILVWFAWLGQRPLFEPDEGRYTQIPREMVASGDWITPRLHGFKYFEKPPLQYWATAAIFQLLGESTTTARLWNAACGLLGALWAWWLGARLYGRRAGFFAFVVTLSGALYYGAGHIVTLDMSLSLFMVVGVGALALAQSRRDDPGHVRNWMLAGWAALGLAVLVKGPVGLVLPGAAVLVYSLWQRDWTLWRHLHLGKGLLLLLAITAPWFIAVIQANPEFAHFFFIHEHLERYTTTVHRRDGPIYYFLLILLGGALPWTAVMMGCLLRPGFPWWPQRDTGFEAERFLWVFAVVVFLFFSLGHSKLAGYILPMIPVLSVLAGRRLAERGFHRVDGWLMLGFGLVLIVAGWYVVYLENERIPPELFRALRPWLFSAGGVMLLGGALVLKAWKSALVRVAVAGILALISYRLLLTGYGILAPSLSSRDLARAIQAEAPEAGEIFVVAGFDPNTLPFYLKRAVLPAINKGELELGIEQEPERWIATNEEFLRRWQTSERPVAVLSPQLYEQYREQRIPMHVFFRGPRTVAVTR